MSEEEVNTTEEASGVLGSDVEPSQPQEAVSDSDPYSSFLEKLPDHLKGNETIANTKSFESLADQLVNAQKALGAKKDYKHLNRIGQKKIIMNFIVSYVQKMMSMQFLKE